MNAAWSSTLTTTIALIALLSAPATAEPITFAFSAHVTGYDVLVGDPSWVRQVMPLGTRLEGRYTFEASTPDRVASPFVGEYAHDPVAHRKHGFHSTTLADYRIGERTPPPGSGFVIGVFDFPTGPFDSYNAMQDFVAIDGGAVPLYPGSLSLGAYTTELAWLRSDALPRTPPDLRFPGVEASVLMSAAPVDARLAPVNVWFRLDSLTLVPAPAGASMTLILSGIATGRRVRRSPAGPVSTRSRPQAAPDKSDVLRARTLSRAVCEQDHSHRRHPMVPRIVTVIALAAAPAFAQCPLTNHCLAFAPPSGRFVSVPSDPSLRLTSAVTVEAWIFPTTVNQHIHGLAGIWNDLNGANQRAYLLDLYLGRPRFHISHDGTIPGFRPIAAVGQAVPNRWTHIAGTYDGAMLRIFVDGVLANSLATAGAIYSHPTLAFRIGRSDSGGNGPWYFPGQVDEVRVWSVARTAEQIRELMHVRVTGPRSGLVGCWPMDEGQGTIVADVSGLGNHGTAVSAPAWRASTAPVSACYADCDCGTGLDIFDFLCFQNRFDANDPYACDCDTTSGPGVCDIFDFLCFQNAFAAGCP